MNPEKAEHWGAQLLRFFTWLGPRVRKRQIQADVQSSVNRVLRELDKDAEGLAPLRVRVEYVQDIDRAEMLKNRTVLIRIRDRVNDDKNLVHATLAFCPLGVLAPTRPFLAAPMRDAIDYSVARKVLLKANRINAVNYLQQEVIQPELDSSGDLTKCCESIDRINEAGHWALTMRELLHFGVKCMHLAPVQGLIDEASTFVEYVDIVAQKERGVPLGVDFFRSEHIAAAVMFVGMPQRITSEGADPYLRHLLYLSQNAIDRVYMLALGGNTGAVRGIAQYAEKVGFGTIIRMTHSTIFDRLRRIPQPNVVVEFTLEPTEAAKNWLPAVASPGRASRR